MSEIWKNIEGFENYQISNLGRVRNVKTSRVLRPGVDKDGYGLVVLRKDNKRHTRKIHRLVAQTFLINPNNLPCVNHKDENKLNNNVRNLEWCTHKYNSNYGTSKERLSIKHTNHPNKSKPVLCVETGVTYPSVNEAARQSGFSNCNISNACNGIYKTYRGYHWQYIT